MDLLYLALAITFFGFVWFGFWRGLIQTAGSIVGIFIGIVLASRWYDDILAFLSKALSGNQMASVIVFIVLFLIIVKLMGLIFALFFKVVNIATFLPGMKFLDHLAGGILGAVEGTLVIGVALNFIDQIGGNTAFGQEILSSGIASFFMTIASWLIPLFPKALRDLNEVINKV